MTPFGYAAPGGGNFGRSSGGVDLGEQCWKIWDTCQVTIATFACAGGLCPAEVRIYKVRNIRLAGGGYGCENCVQGSIRHEPVRVPNFCPATLIPPARLGTHKLFNCVLETTICTANPGPAWFQSLDFNCGLGALGSRGDDQEKLAAKMEECMERKYGDAMAPGGSEAKLCETLCDLANMTNPPGGGPDGTPGGIGNAQMCAETPAGVGPISKQGGYSWQQESCEDKLSSEYMKALEEWLDKFCE